MDKYKLTFLGPMLFLKFSLLAAIIVALTIVKPAISAAHTGAQKICSFIMKSDDCAKHC